MKNIVIIDAGLGNLYSVEKACFNQGINTQVSAVAEEIAQADALILPGVGAFACAMEKLKKAGVDEAIKEVVAKGNPMMGICLGMQLMVDSSEEFSHCGGLSLIKGKTLGLPLELKSGQKVKRPQINWNRVHLSAANQKLAKGPFDGIADGEYMYFIHSYYVELENPDFGLATTTYAQVQYCSSFFKDNLFAVQFHPEKSGLAGLKIYANWANYFELKGR